MLAIVHFTDTITLGAGITAIAVGSAGLVTFGYGVRWKSNFQTEKATADSLRDGREAYRLAAERLTGEVQAQRELKHKALTELAAERLKTDLTSVVKTFHEQHIELMEELKHGREQIVVQVVEHLQLEDGRHEKRHEAILEALQELTGQIKQIELRREVRK